MMQYKFLDPEEIVDTSDFKFIWSFLNETRRTQIGWHYIIDLTWIYSQVKNWPTTYQVLDAGGGGGATQFLLTELGFNVTNLDLFLGEPSYYLQRRYRMKFVKTESYQESEYVVHLANQRQPDVFRYLKEWVAESRLYQYMSMQMYQWRHEQWRKSNLIFNEVGHLDWVRANLCYIPEVPSGSFDAVVSLSALEHIPIDLMAEGWSEIGRICKRNAKVAITTSGTEKKRTWFHESSKGNCFSEHDLQVLFNAKASNDCLPANKMIRKYQVCEFLKTNIADFYKKSGQNGMPYGRWGPKYFPVALFQ